MSKQISKRRLIFFLLLSLFAIAQVTWWIILQIRIGDHISSIQRQSWNNQITVVRDWAENRYSGDSEKLKSRIADIFPDLEYDDQQDEIAVRDEALQRLEESTSRIIRMILFEGTFFSFVVIVGLLYMYWTVRREAQIERHFSNFLAAITHELKTPLTAMRLFLDALKIPDQDEVQLEEIHRSLSKDLNRLDQLIDKLLQARGDVSLEKRHFEVVDLSEETKKAIHNFTEILYKDHSDRILSRISSGIYARIDVEQWRILINNLIENGLKYSDEAAQVTVKLDRKGKHAELSIIDQGIGIERSERKLIFKRFYRTGEEDIRRSRGSGVGLYLVNEIAKNLAGNVSVQSEGKGRGAVFIVRIPIVERLSDA